MKRIITVLTLATVSLWAGPQDIKFPASLEKLADKAEEVTDITLDANTLGFASSFLSDKTKDEKAAKDLVKGLKGIYIRSYEFEEEGAYSMADLGEIRSQLKPPEWVSIVSVRSKKDGENTQIYLKKQEGKIVGLTILAAEPTELTIVHIVGSIKPEDLAKLGGNFGIPNISMGPAGDNWDDF